MNSIRLNLIYSFCVSFKGAQGSQGTSGIPGLAGPTVSHSSCKTFKISLDKKQRCSFFITQTSIFNKENDER